ncbi:MAG: hypothetical protein Q9201_007298 [Fulgogasparrea decipioides]
MDFIRRLRSQKNDVEAQSIDEGLAETSQPVHTSSLGLRVVNPYQVNAVIDVIFIHGLTGNRELTWTAKGAAACWPELFLVNDLPEARIITYGYDADVVNFWSMASQNTIADHSQKFLSSLANLRDSSTRPLAFVAHSMGGIVCQDALLKSKNSADQHTQHIFEHTKGILFMGTPHCGSDLAEWADIGNRFLRYFRRVNHETLAILDRKSEVMARIRRNFHTMLRGRDQKKDREIAIICFYEELPVRFIGEIVPKHSASLDRYTSIGIHANHTDMTKFTSDQDPDYRNVLSELQRFVQACKQQTKRELPSAASESPEIQGQSDHGIGNESSSAGKGDQNVMREKEKPYGPTKPVNTFSGTFNTNGGKIIQGNEFNSGGGPMTF